MKEVVATTEIAREKGFLYFITSDEKGFLMIVRSKSGRKKKNESQQ